MLTILLFCNVNFIFRFYFTEQTRVGTTTAGESSVVQMIGSLYDAIEADYGVFSTRLYRAFRPKPSEKLYLIWFNNLGTIDVLVKIHLNCDSIFFCGS